MHSLDYQVGLEREALRVTPQGKLSKKSHPKSLGSALTHPLITTDFAEMQLEVMTKPFSSHQEALQALCEVLSFVTHQIDDELLWPASTPPYIPENCTDLIAKYGPSLKGKIKEIYRKGLYYRYGNSMQLFSGIHYNFSFSKNFWKKFGGNVSENYLHIIRNFLREGWIISYLFGASPDDKMATSIRMSPKGYYSRIQAQYPISFNDMRSYLSDLEKALITPCKKYQKIPVGSQLNHHLLQIENEHYTRIRPKRKGEEIDYLEIRSLDINPLIPLGIDEQTMQFLHIFLLYCLHKKSPPLSKEEEDELCKNQSFIALEGRTLPNTPFHAWAHQILDEMEKLTDLSFQSEREKIDDPEKTPSGILAKMQPSGLQLAKDHRAYFLKQPYDPQFKQLALDSLVEEKILNTLERSTQILIHEAQKRKIHVEILDWNANIIKLSKNGHIECVKQATITSKDSYLSYHLMGNKAVTKKMLEQEGICTPAGTVYNSTSEALLNIPTKKVVIKPNSTNFGHGVRVFNGKNYEEAVHNAFSYDTKILIETFIPGDEYRFLVVNDRIIAIARREPANVIGDGLHTIEELITLKNLSKPIEAQIPMLKSTKILPVGEKYIFQEISNISMGGDPIDVTDKMHPFYKEKALQAAKIFQVKICGVDMIIEDPDHVSTYTILEVNYNPMISMHHLRDVGNPILDLLGFSARDTSSSIRSE